MSGDSEPEVENANEPKGNAPNAPEGSMPEGEANSAMANFRQGFFTESRYGVLLALGEEPQEYRMEDSCLRRMWRLINAFGKVRQGVRQKKRC
jgi:hypothetical protein